MNPKFPHYKINPLHTQAMDIYSVMVCDMHAPTRFFNKTDFSGNESGVLL